MSTNPPSVKRSLKVLWMSNLHRRDTGFITQTPYRDPSSKIWRLYLSQAEKVDKQQSEYWTANVNGVLVFVRHILWRLYCSHPEDLIRAVFSLRWWLRSLFSAFRCYSPVQLMPPTNCSPKSPSNYQQMGQGQHSHCLLLTSLHSNPPLLSCV